MERKPDETFEEYKKRRKKEKKKEKEQRKGKTFWDSKEKGTYRRG